MNMKKCHRAPGSVITNCAYNFRDIGSIPASGNEVIGDFVCGNNERNIR